MLCIFFVRAPLKTHAKKDVMINSPTFPLLGFEERYWCEAQIKTPHAHFNWHKERILEVSSCC